MTEYAPAAIQGVYNRITVGSKQMSGIIGDQAHTYGYHRCRDVLPGNDYSRVLQLDLQGDGQAASALDVKFSSADMKTVSNRLLSAAKANDGRLRGLREFGGTVDGVNTKSYDLAARHEGTNEWDDTHLWHVHLSFYRAYANSASVLNTIADVINAGGTPAPPPKLPRPGQWSLPPGHWFGPVTGPDEQHSGDPAYDDDAVRYGVKQIQDRVNAMGYNAGYADGIYGDPETVSGVKRWQAAVKRSQTGLMKQDDWAVLFGASPAAPPAKPPATPPAASLKRPWPSYMPADHYFGLITGPDQSHGGYYANEQPDVQAIQQRLQTLTYAPGTAGWADGIFEQPTADAVAAWQRAQMPGTEYYGQVWQDDWTKLFTY